MNRCAVFRPRGHARAPRAGAALLCAAALVLGGCTGGTSASQEAPWAAGVEEFLSAWAAAEKVGFTSSAPFYAPDIHQDFRGFNNFEGTGRDAIVQNLRDSMQIPPRFLGGFDQADSVGSGNAEDEPLYLSLDSVVPVTHSIDWEGISAAAVLRIGQQGITDQVGLPAASFAAAAFELTIERFLPPARRFTEAWASGIPAEVAALYAEDAVLDDQMVGLHAKGASDISALADQPATLGGLGPARLHALPGEAGPAVYVTGDFEPYFEGKPVVVDELLLLLDVAPDEDCPGPVAVQIMLDDAGLITHEERFHRIDALRRCRTAPQLPSGWWDRVQIPDLPAVPRTGSAPAADGGEHDIAVWNGDTQLTPLITWALQRFADTGLPPPTVTSVTFLPDVPGDRWATYGFLTGTDAPDIGVPVTVAEACTGDPCTWTARARAAMLHELAHLWLAGNPSYAGGRPSYSAGLPRNRAFLSDHGLTWHDPALPWGSRGNERAAETIAWGLMDQPYTVDSRLGPLTCAELTADFQTLTYSAPDPRSCAGTAPGGEPGHVAQQGAAP